jgi:hypothetical protein
LQLSQEDKRDMARKIYNATPERERNDKKAQRLVEIVERAFEMNESQRRFLEDMTTVGSPAVTAH